MDALDAQRENGSSADLGRPFAWLVFLRPNALSRPLAGRFDTTAAVGSVSLTRNFMRRKFRVAAKLFWYRLVLLAAFCWRRLMFRTRFIAITGSVGKTTAKNLLAALLGDMPARTLSTRHSSNDVKHIARDLLRVRPW